MKALQNFVKDYRASGYVWGNEEADSLYQVAETKDHFVLLFIVDEESNDYQVAVWVKSTAVQAIDSKLKNGDFAFNGAFEGCLVECQKVFAGRLEDLQRF